MMSYDEGVSILNKLRDESSHVLVRFVEHKTSESFGSRVLKVELPLLILAKYEVASWLVNLLGAEFRYSDPREAVVPGQATATFEFCLQISWPEGSILRLYKVRDDLDPLGI
jgi:hypothetical protein